VVNRKIPDILTEEEQKKLLDVFNIRYLSPHRNKTMIKLFLDSGLRLSEMINLKWKHINLQTGKLKVVQGKGAKDRVIWINDGVLDMLREWRERQAQDIGSTEYVFSTKTGGKLNPRDVREMVYIYTKKAEISDKEVSPHTFRHTFAMVASSSKNMSRIELVYTVNANLIKKLKQLDKKAIPESCLNYLEKGYKKETIYKTQDKDAESKLEFLLKKSQMLYKASKKSSSNIEQTEEFKTLKRMLGEQTDNADFDKLNPGELKIKDGQDLSSDILQNPSDPDATYRYKYGPNIGYTANMVEIFDEEHSVIKDYDFKPNIYSDQKFSKDTIEKLDIDKESKNPLKMLVDGAYFTLELAELAINKGIELIPGQLIGRKESASKLSFAKIFQINEDNLITECINGQNPYCSKYDDEKEVITAKFAKENCSNCSFKKQCRIQFQKKTNTVRFNRSRYLRDTIREKMDTKEYVELTNQRAGIEGLPSVFRRKYNVDNMPVRGEVRSKLYFGFKVLATNVKRLFNSPVIGVG